VAPFAAGRFIVGNRGKVMWGRRTHARVGAPVLLSVVGLALVGPVPAAQALSGTPVPGFQTNGRVTSIVTFKNTVYVGGDFTSVRPAGAPAGTGEVSRNHLAAFRADNGALRSWNPGANGTVSALALSPDNHALYVGGNFSQLNGKKRHNLGAVARKSGGATKYKANTNGPVLAIAVTKKRVFLGGAFTTVKDKRRKHIGATDRRGHLLLHWKPRAGDVVRSLAISRDKSRVYVGGDFSAINKKRHEHLAALGVVSGKVLKWRSQVAYSVWDIVVRKKSVYLGGNGIGGRIGAYTALGKRNWAVQVDGGVQAISFAHRKILAGGHFYNVCVGISPGQTPGFDCPPGQIKGHRPHLAAFGAKTGGLKGWNPTMNSPLGVFALTTTKAGVYAGGDFTRVSGVNQQGLAHFS
jgi:hypothetical protein